MSSGNMPEISGWNPISGRCVLSQNLGHELYTLTAVPRSTQPSALWDDKI